MKTTLDEMFVFVTIAELGSLTRAAEKLYRPTSAMSSVLRRLEQKLDTTVIRRTTRVLELTGEGQIFLDHARSIIASVELAEEQIVAHREQLAGQLRINAATPFMQHVIVPMIPEFHRNGYSQLDSLNAWPLHYAGHESYRVQPKLRASSGETVLALVTDGAGIAGLGDYMTTDARRHGRLVELLVEHTVERFRPIHAVYYRNTRLAARIAIFLDFVTEPMRGSTLVEQDEPSAST
ncbi:hypothetical protein LMG27952_02897 [Paraburkholderia hiiakae]|uniref:HTH lysR-type domain-containing protein n=1 Tax=Paraburkholderia hiiakae TaxID=1081782 RepID=A0ABN7HVE4_9BURK|nr:LysR family transcriptional regulator [Paraburkholderia hiiakae]CAD6534181.1 hypothetical protein LMG27952_02897 [Paraburkholderia hiiakae]